MNKTEIIKDISSNVATITDIDELFRLQSEIGVIINEIYHEDKPHKGDIITARNALDICKNRIDIISERNKILNNDANRVNHNFRINSKKILKKSTYNTILDNSYKTLKESGIYIRENDYRNIE